MISYILLREVNDTEGEVFFLGFCFLGVKGQGITISVTKQTYLVSS